MNFRSYIGKKVYCRTVANEQIHMLLTHVTPNYIVFESANKSEYRVPIYNVLEIGETGVQLIKGQSWQE